MTTTGDGNVTQMTDIHDIKPALGMGFDLQWLFWVLAILVLLGLVWLAWHRWRQRQKPKPVAPQPPPVPPDTEAMQALDDLSVRDGISGKQFYFALSAIVRRYVERRFDFPAAEMTTEELIPWVNRLPLEAGLSSALAAFCRSTDPIKFAAAASDRNQMGQDMTFARRFVEQTTRSEADGEQSSSAENREEAVPSVAGVASSEMETSR